jgi:DNA-binding response OmpR family regulator
MAHIRAEVLAQPPAERVDYALDLLAFYLDPLPAFFEGCAALGLALSNAEIRMLHALDAKRGRYVSLNALLSARCLDVSSDDWPSQDKVVKGLSLIRGRLKKLGLPVEITTWRGFGYCLEAPAEFRFEAAAPAAPARPGGRL